MGLLKKVSDSGVVKETIKPSVVEEIPVQKKSNSVGLMKKSLIVSKDNSSNDRLDFFEFIKVYDIDICSLLIPGANDDKYIAQTCFGMDAHSICMSVSTKDFWNGLLKQENIIYNFSKKDNSILPLNQFFSSKLIDKINTIHAIKRSDGIIILFATDSYFNPLVIGNDISKIETTNLQTNAYAPASDKYLKSKSYYLYTADFTEAIDSFIISNYKNELQPQLKQTILNDIFYGLIKNFPEPSFIGRDKNGIIKIAYCLNNEIPMEVISNHLRFNSSFILDEHSQLLSLDLLGKAGAYTELKEFLEV